MSVKDLATKNTKDTKKVWPKVRLGDVCEFRRGLTYSKGDEAELSSNVVLRSNNVSLETGKLDFTELKYLKETFVIPADKKVVQSSLLMCMANGSKPHLGKVALIDKDYGYAFGGFMGLLVPNDIDPKYLYLALTSAQFKSRIKSLQDGANINNLKFADIADFHFPLPPLSAQREIVARLEKELGEADKLAAKFKRVAELADDAFKAELDETFKALEGERVRLGQVEDTGRIILGRGKIISKIDINACPGDYPVYSSSAMGDGEIGRYGKYMFDDKRITWSIDGGGRLFYRDVARYSVTNVCGWLKVVDPQIDTKYLYYGLTSAWLEIDFNYVHKAHPSVIRNEYYVALPPASIQRAIVAKLDAAKERCEKLKAAAMRGHAAAENLRKAILAEAFEQ